MTTDNASNKSLNTERQRIEEMINSPQVRDVRDRNRQENGYIRPRNASTMILVDTSGNEARILMGRRNKKLKFMPGALVFPGGSVDKYDGSVSAISELDPITEGRLLNAMRGRPTKRGARALAMAAIREVAEESGLLIGSNGDFKSKIEDWSVFEKHQVIPALSQLRLFSRAITPPGLSRRFDTWFFIAPISSVGFTPEGGFDPDGELEDLQWITPDNAINEETREITRVMLVELINRLKSDPKLEANYPAPYYHTVGSRFTKKII